LNGLALLPWRRRDALLATLRRRSLDGRLATGQPPECSRLLAVRSAHLTSRASRRRIARRWDALAVNARARFSPSQLSVAEVVQRVADVLCTDEPVGVQGVALALTRFKLAADAIRRAGPAAHDIAAAVARTAIETM
jgi:hypothetical protein